MNNIIESNKLIAEFMDLKVWENEFVRDIDEFGVMSKMQYNSSYDWLMPVAEKIEQSGYDSVIEFSDFTYQCTFLDVIIGVTASTKIEAIYGAVIQFIQWYNKQNKEL